MKVKKFLAANMQEAMQQIKNDLGKDAVILSSKHVYKGGILGFFAKKKVEVIAGHDPDPVFRTVPAPKKEPPQEVPSEASLLSEMREVKSLVKSLREQEEAVNLPQELKELERLLAEKEVQGRADILSELREMEGERSLQDWVQIASEIMAEKLAAFPFNGISHEKKYILAAGPTGVGKTTTLAKLAAESMLKEQKKIAFITTDTYRIAAIDQIRTYAGILNAPLKVCYTPEDVKEAKEAFAEMDAVFIDTAGRNYRNKLFVQELKDLLGANDDTETYLVLSAASKYSDMQEIYMNFSAMNPEKLIFTKIDETAAKGSLYDFVQFAGLGVSYFSNGQNVPDDIMPASAKMMAEEIMR